MRPISHISSDKLEKPTEPGTQPEEGAYFKETTKKTAESDPDGDEEEIPATQRIGEKDGRDAESAGQPERPGDPGQNSEQLDPEMGVKWRTGDHNARRGSTYSRDTFFIPDIYDF